ncbi:exodeoxyribonuclease I [Bacterioplanes sanyensis]|uniref:Exodeoxyribonuclease I n=1 Tax=Bacterioplanes sanyensis TaxID=1249553 RepID=A0A222FLQ1_9GAMM|nr:exodeoxyribonuclease I [Bacterioplanes sanyensis]ASP39444.1 exodeoxyribonuclease I [Bacterioplanes sanyensis]
MNSIVWYDYETFGAHPAWDRPAQFAAIRTDEDLNEIEPPVELFCRQSDDYLPHPQAVLITGITPQTCNQCGVSEREFITQINAMLSQPGTCSAGYNSIRFDDEVTRHALYRNFYDPYAREWQGGNSRWDILDAMRCAYALRPEGIEWPKHDDGRTSFKLEHLTAANGLDHGQAHDAVSDVRATIALARLLRDKQPKLYRYLYGLRFKNEVGALVDVQRHRPLVHISGMYSVEQGCMALVAPLCWHPSNKNAFIAFDLNHDPTALFELDAEQIAQRIFTRQSDLPEGVERLPLKEVHINKAPVLAPAKTLTPDRAEHWGISGERLRTHLARLQQLEQSHGSLVNKLHQVYSSKSFADAADVDGQLYGGFFSRNDKQAMEDLHRLSGWDLVDWPAPFADPRGEELLFRYRARNFPETLEGDERERWESYRRQRLLHGVEGSSLLTFEQFARELQQLAQQLMEQGDEKRLLWLQELQFYAESIYPADD